MAGPEQPSENIEFHPLPPVSAHLAGTTHHVDKAYQVEVSNKAGYLCHTQVDAQWDLPPQDVFDIMVYPNNTKLFRDIKHVGGRTVVSEEATKRVVKVEQVGEMRVLWMTRKYSTWLNVVEDWSDPHQLSTGFTLLSSDVLSKFNGSWELRPREEDGVVTGTIGVLHHDVLPKGVPPFLQHVPVLGGLLRGISMRAVRRVMEDLQAAVDKIKAGHKKGQSTLEVLQAVCGVYHAENSLPPTSEAPVHSFALDLHDDAESSVIEDDEGSVAGAEGRKRASTPSGDRSSRQSPNTPHENGGGAGAPHASNGVPPAGSTAVPLAPAGAADGHAGVDTAMSPDSAEPQQVVLPPEAADDKDSVTAGSTVQPDSGMAAVTAPAVPPATAATEEAAQAAAVPWGV